MPLTLETNSPYFWFLLHFSQFDYGLESWHVFIHNSALSMQPRGNHVSDQIIHKEVGVELYICLQADSP